MKKIKTVVIVVFLLLFTGCHSATDNSNVAAADHMEKCVDGVFFTSYHRIAIGPNGYYFLNMPGTEGYVTYFDKKSKEETYLCSKPDCGHVDESIFHYGLPSCDAYIGCVVSGSLIYNNNFLYYLEYDRETYDVMLVRMSTDGSIHEKIMKIGQAPDFGSYYKYVFADKNTIFITYDDPDTAGNDRIANLIKIDLKMKKMTTVYSCRGTDASFSCLKVMGGDLFFLQTTKEKDTCIQQLVNLDLNTSQINIVIDESIHSYTLVGNQQLAYLVSKDGLYLYDMETMQSRRIRLSDDNTMFAVLACDGKYLYLDNIENRYFFDETSEREIFVCDLDGELIRTIPAGPVYTEFCDGDYMFTKIFIQGENGGEFWSYIKNSDMTDPSVEWTVLQSK